MQGDLPHRILQTIERHQMFRPGDRVGAAVSGGADSVALLRLLLGLREGLGIRLAVLHFNHQLRGAESEDDERFVAQLAAEHALEFRCGREDVGGAARERGWNVEDAARRLRYAFFQSLIAAGHLDRVAVAHTADDQAETVLARLVRGTGPGGLAAIYPVKGHVVRPLIEVRRCELRDYLERQGQPWREDPSNLDLTRLRARLRHRVLPLLEREFQPAIVEHLCTLAGMARRDEAFWQALVEERMGALLRQERGRTGICCADLLAPAAWAGTPGGDAQLALAGRLVRGIIGRLQGDPHQLTARHVADVLRLAAGSHGGRRAEIPGAVVERSFDWLWFRATRAGETASESTRPARQFSQTVELGAPGQPTEIVVPEIGRRFLLKLIDAPTAGEETMSQPGALDADLLRSPLVLRNWRPGDCYRPKGRRKAHKLKQLLRESRVARDERQGWPVLTSAGEVVWARQFPAAAEFAARTGSQRVVLVVEEEL